MNDFSSFISARLPGARDLDRDELVQLATAVGTTRELWRDRVRHDPGERIYMQLFRDTHVDVWMICWLDDQKTGYHDHDVSSGAVYVVEGELVEDRFHFGVRGLTHASRKRPAGAAFDFDAAYIHGIRHAGGPPATSIHCYSPPLWRMGYYDADQHGSLIRTSLSYLEEVAEGRAD
jgi:cysteine dioxygenase type I